MSLSKDIPPENIVAFLPQIHSRKNLGCLHMFLRNFNLENQMYKNGDPWIANLERIKVYKCHQAIDQFNLCRHSVVKFALSIRVQPTTICCFLYGQDKILSALIDQLETQFDQYGYFDKENLIKKTISELEMKSYLLLNLVIKFCENRQFQCEKIAINQAGKNLQEPKLQLLLDKLTESIPQEKYREILSQVQQEADQEQIPEEQCFQIFQQTQEILVMQDMGEYLNGSETFRWLLQYCCPSLAKEKSTLKLLDNIAQLLIIDFELNDIRGIPQTTIYIATFFEIYEKTSLNAQDSYHADQLQNILQELESQGRNVPKVQEVDKLRQMKVFKLIFKDNWVKYTQNNPDGLILRNTKSSKLDVKTDNLIPLNYETDDSSDNFSKSHQGTFVTVLQDSHHHRREKMQKTSSKTITKKKSKSQNLAAKNLK